MKTKEKQFREQIWKFWTPIGAENPPCILFTRCGNMAITLHEIDPKSVNQDWLDQPFNSVPICAECHNRVQIDPSTSGIELRELVVQQSQNICDWKGTNYDRVIRELYNGDEE